MARMRAQNGTPLMTDDILERLREMERIQSQWDSRPEPRWKEAADEIQRLRKRNNYLRQELSATDYRKREQAEEIQRLRTLITAAATAQHEDDLLDVIEKMRELTDEWE